MTESAGAVISEMKAQRDRAMARVQELEAEYDSETARLAAWGGEWKARAEKAEAEVERLRTDCRSHTRNHRVPGHTHPEPCCLADYPGFHCGVNPSGDTLGAARKERDG